MKRIFHKEDIFHNPPTSGSSDKIVYADIHRAQQAFNLKIWLHKCKETMINVIRGTINRVQPLGVSINKPFKNYVQELFEQILDANLELNVEGRLTVGKRWILTTKWVAKAWDTVKKQPHII